VVAVCCGATEVVAVVCCGTPEVVVTVCCGTLEVVTAVFSVPAAITLDSAVVVPVGVGMLSLSFPHVFDGLLSFCKILSCAKVGDMAVISNGD